MNESAKWAAENISHWKAARDELSGKPSWGDAPEWAKWLAQDGDGYWYFFEKAPAFIRKQNVFRSVGKEKCGCKGRVLGDWRNTLERRPAAEPTEWRGPEDGLPPVGMRVLLSNKQCYFLDYMEDVVGQEVTVKAVFYSGDSNIPMAAIETDEKECGCFRVSMLEPGRTEEDKAVNEMRKHIKIGMTPDEILRALYAAGYKRG